MAKLSLGSLTMAALATFAAQGYITGGGPTDPDLKQLKRQTLRATVVAFGKNLSSKTFLQGAASLVKP